MNSLKNEENAILIHIDILTEGIDLPAITGVLPFRELNLIKLLQTIGRGTRLLKEDRQKIYSGEIKPMEWEKMIKPFCWVIFPRLDSSESTAESMEKTISEVLKQYSVPTLQFSREDEFIGEVLPDIIPITQRDKSAKVDKETELMHVIEDLMIGQPSPGYKAISNILFQVADKDLRV
jgi:excinuclease UvrABC helicase subunit UvrB